MPLKITYWSLSTKDPNIAGHIISSESLAISATSAQSAATPANADLVCITATEVAAFDYSGTNPTALAGATGTSSYLAANTERWMDAIPGNKIAGIQAT